MLLHALTLYKELGEVYQLPSATATAYVAAIHEQMQIMEEAWGFAGRPAENDLPYLAGTLNELFCDRVGNQAHSLHLLRGELERAQHKDRPDVATMYEQMLHQEQRITIYDGIVLAIDSQRDRNSTLGRKIHRGEGINLCREFSLTQSVDNDAAVHFSLILNVMLAAVSDAAQVDGTVVADARIHHDGLLVTVETSSPKPCTIPDILHILRFYQPEWRCFHSSSGNGLALRIPPWCLRDKTGQPVQTRTQQISLQDIPPRPMGLRLRTSPLRCES